MCQRLRAERSCRRAASSIAAEALCKHLVDVPRVRPRARRGDTGEREALRTVCGLRRQRLGELRYHDLDPDPTPLRLGLQPEPRRAAGPASRSYAQCRAAPAQAASAERRIPRRPPSDAIPAPVAARAASASPTAFVVTHVRQALQHTAAVGADSAYLPAAWPTRPVQISFMP